jgi:Big-like domain-containing protein/type IX secretion system substrate protein/peptidase C39-like protein
MKSLLIYLLVFFLSGVSWADSEIVDQEVIDAIAMRNAEALWGEVAIGEKTPYYYSDNELVACRYNFHKGDKFPDEPDISANEGFCTMLLSARRDMPVVLEHSETLSHEYLLETKLQSMAEKEVGKGYILERAYYLTTANVWYCVSNNGEKKYIRLLPPAKVVEESEFFEFAATFNFFCDREDFSEEWSAFESGRRELSRNEVLLENHEYMPFYSWHHGCGPTAAAMLLAWFDYNSINTVQNYSNLVDWHYKGWDDVPDSVQWHHFDYHIPNTSYELADEMETDGSGSTYCDNMVPGTCGVANSYHDYEFTGSQYDGHGTTWYFNNIKDFVDDGLPIMIWINENHFVTAMGYCEANNEIAIHDPNVGSIDWISKSIIDGSYAIWPDGGYGYAFNLQYPHGDLRYFPWGNGDSGEVYAGNEICEITWLTDAVNGYDQNVTLLYITDSEEIDLHIIAENQPNTGYYWWQVPNNIDSDSCRVWIELYDDNGTLIGADGSYGDFEIHPGGSFEELTYDDRVSTTSDPDFFWFDHNESNWGVVGVRSDDVSDNWGLALFNDADFSQVIKGSQYYAGNVNLIAIDGNHAPSPERALRVAHYDNETTSDMAKVEMEGEPDESLMQGMNPQETWPAGDVAEIWDAYLTPGVYTITLDVLSGNANLNLGIFGSTPGYYYKGISELLTSSTNHGPGQDEVITVNITQADHYGVCAWALNESSAEFRINIGGPGVWEGSVNGSWGNAGNWANGIVPDEDTDVLIPAGVTYFPLITGDITRMCRNLVIEEGAELETVSGSLDINGSADIYGTINLAAEGRTIWFRGPVHWYGSSTLYEAFRANVWIYRDWIADEGADIHFDESYVAFTGSEDCILQINTDDHLFGDFHIQKNNNADVIFSEDSDEELEISGTFDLVRGEFIVMTEAPVIIHNNLSATVGGLNFEVGSINFSGSGLSSIFSGGVNVFCEIYVEEGHYLIIHDPISLHTLVNDGGLYIDGETIQVSGGWFNNGVMEDSEGSTVIFNGVGNQYVNEADFASVMLNKPFGGELIISNGSVMHCESFDYTSGTIRVNGGSFTAEDISDVCVKGNYILDGGSIDLHQGTTDYEYVDLDANIWIYDGTFNIHGGYDYPSEWACSRNITVYMDGGILDFKDNGIFISETGHELNDIITGGIIRTSGDFKVDENGFYPAGSSQIELYGGGTAYCYNNPGSSFRNVRVNKGSDTREEDERDRFNRVIFNNNTTVDQDVLIESGFIQLSDATLTIGDDLLVYDGLNMDAANEIIYVADDVTWYNGSGATVYNGEFHVGGNWMFYNGIDCEFEPGNVVYFDGTTSSTISSYSTSACFGDVKIDKETGSTEVHSYNNNTVQIAGDLEVLSDNTFELHGNDLRVDGMIDLYTGSTFNVDDGGELNVSNLVMQGNMNVYGGTVTVIDNFHQYSSSHLQLWGGDFIIDMPYEGSHESITGYLFMDGGNMQVTNNGIQFGEDAHCTQNEGLLKIGWGFRALYPGTFQQDGGTIEFTGTGNSQISFASNNWFNEVIINKTGYSGNCQMADPITINENLTIQDGKLSTVGNQLTVWKSINISEEGILDADEGLVLVGENWNNEHGTAGFVETNSMVRFFNYMPGDILYDETFYNMTILKDLAPGYYLEIAESVTVNVLNNLHISDGTLMMHTDSSFDVDRDITIEDGAGLNCYFTEENTTINIGRHWYDYNDEITFQESFNRGQSTVTFDGETNQVVEVTRAPYEFENLTIDQTGDYFLPQSNMMVVGDLNIINGCWNNGDQGMTHYLSGNVAICEDGWWDNMGTVIFYSTREASFERFGTGVEFCNVIIDKNPVWGRDETREPAALTLASDLIMLWGGDLTIESGTLLSEGNTISCSGNVTINGGTLWLEPDSRLRVGNDCALDVNAGGTLHSVGTEEYPVDITCYNAGNYHEVNINADGMIAAEYTNFQYMSENGVFVILAGTVDEDYAFNHCTFQNGIENGFLLRIRNEQELTCYDAVFPENTWGSAYNVYKNRNAGNIEFINASGGFSGESYDYDPYQRIDWSIIIPPEITVYADDPMDYGEVIVGETGSLGIDIENTGTMDLTGTITTPDGYTVSFWARDGEEIVNRNALSFTVEGGSLHTYRVDFEPVEVMTYAGEIVIEHNADSDTEIVNVTGIGIPIPPPACEIWIEEIAFGDVIINESKTEWFTIYNSGGSTLEGTIAVPDGYYVEEAVWRSYENPEEEHHREMMNTRNIIDLEIEPGYMVEFSLVFEPFALQEYNGVLEITHNAPGGETLIAITGRGVDAILSYDPYVLTSVLTPGETDSQVLTLGNEGNLDINYLAYIQYENVDNNIINEGFEDDFPPTGWSMETTGWDNWYQGDYEVFNGDYCAEVSAMDDDLRLTTPWFTATDDCLLRYWYKGLDNFWEDWMTGLFQVEVSTNGSTWVVLSSISQEFLPYEWEAGGIALGDYAGQNIKVSFHVLGNSMARGVKLDDVVIMGEANPTYQWLSINNASNLTGTIPAGDPAEEINVSFYSTGLAESDYYAYVYLLSNDTSDPMINIPVALNVGVYDLTVTPASLDFGAIDVLTEATLQFTLENTGTLELDGEITMPEGYLVEEPGPEIRNDTQTYHLFQGSSFTYNATFTPENHGNFDGDIIISNVWNDTVELLPVTGTGLAPEIDISESMLFIEQQPGNSTTGTLTLSNNGNDLLEYSASVDYMRDNRDILVSSGFENEFPPVGWQLEDLAWTGDWWQDMNPHTGTFAAAADPYMMVDARIITPQFTATPDCQLSYYIRTYNQPDAGGSFGVEVSLDGTNWTFLEEIDMSTLSLNYQQRTLSLAEYSGSNIRVAFRMYDNVNYYCAGLLLDDVEISGNPVALDEWLTLDGEESVSGSIEPGYSSDIIVGYDAVDLPEGFYMADIVIDCNDPMMPQQGLMAEMIVGYPHISANPDSLDFWDIAVGEEFWQYLYIENMGDLTLTGEISVPDGFTVLLDSLSGFRNTRSGRNRSIFPFEISAWGFQNYYLIFAPEAAQSYDGELVITHNAPEAEIHIPLTAQGCGIPEVSTSEITAITEYSASGGGIVLHDGNSIINSRGICWNELGNPVIEMDMFTVDGAGLGEFTSEMQTLMPGTTYYVRAYSTNYYGCSYGEEVSFVTSGPMMNISTESLPDFGNVGIGSCSIDASYTISGTGLIDDIMIFAPWGFQVAIDDVRNLEFTDMLNIEQVNGEIPETTVYVRFSPDMITQYNDLIMHFTMNSQDKYVQVMGTGVVAPSLNVSVTELPDFGEWEVGTASGAEMYSVSGFDLLGDVVITAPAGFEISLTPDRGLQTRVGNRRNGRSFSNELILTPENDILEETLIFVHFLPQYHGMYSDNIIHQPLYGEPGSVYVSGIGITTPEVETSFVTDVNYTTATCGGEVISDGGMDVSARGSCWSDNPEPDLSDQFTSSCAGIGVFTSILSELNEGSLYYVRAYATNSLGTTYGNQIAFTTLAIPEIDLPESFSFAEDGTLGVDFEPYLSDEDYDPLYLSVNVTANINVNISGFLVTFTAADNWHGSEILTFTVSDDVSRATATDDVEIIVTSVNDAPIADAGGGYAGVADNSGLAEIALSGTDSYDIDGEIINWLWSWDSGNATGEEVFVEFPVGTTEITLTVTDNEGLSDADITQIVITGYENISPVAIEDSYYLMEDESILDNVLLNDYDIDEYPEPLTAELLEGIEHGNLELLSNGDFSYQPDVNWNGWEAFSYRVFDGAAYSEPVFADLFVSPVNDIPEIELPDSYTILEDGFLEVDFEQYINDVDGDVISLTFTEPANFTAIQEDLFVYFEPDENWHGSETLTFTVDDAQSRASATDEMTIIVTPVNDDPVAEAGGPYEGIMYIPDTCEITLDGSASYDPDDDIVEWLWTWESGEVNGEIAVGEFYQGSTEVMLTVTDSEGASHYDFAEVFIIEYQNITPVAIADEYYLWEDNEVTDNVMINDYDVDELPLPLVAELMEDVAHGVLEFQENGEFTYQPDPDYDEWDSFSYRVFDGLDYSEPVVADLFMSSINDAPTIELPDSFTFAEDGMLVVDFADFVDDVDNEDLALSVTGESNIIVDIIGLDVTFSATENWFGNETLTFTIDDQQERISAFDDVDILVISVNDMPIADAGEEYTGQADVTGFCEIMLNGSGSYDIDGEIESWEWSWNGGNAEGEEISAEFPAGTTEITLTVTDNEAGIDTDIAQVIISSYNNLPPVAIADEYSQNEDTELSDNVMANDYDPDDNPLALMAELISDVSNGTLDFAENGDFNYLPDLNWNGTDAFSYRVYDGEAYSEAVAVTLVVNPVNDAPEITANIPEDLDLFVTIESSASTANVAFTLTVEDVDNETLTYNWYVNENLESSSSLNAFDYDFGVGNYIVIGEVTDSEFLDSVTWNLFVYSSMGELEDAEIAVNNTILDPGDLEPAIVSSTPLALAWNVTSYNFTLSFDNNVIAYDDYLIEGTLSENATILITDNGDNIVIEATSTTVLEGAGALIEFYFTPVTAGVSSLEITDFNYNDTFIMNITNGSVTVGNYPPEVILPLNDHNKLEDFTDFQIDLSNHFADLEDDMLDYSSEYDNSEIDISINGEILTISSVLNWYGSAEFTVIASDSQGAFCSDNAVVNISPVNDAPVIELPDSFTFEEDGLLNVDFGSYVNDIDNEDLLLTVTGQNQITVGIVGLIVTFTSEAGWSGSEILTFTINDDLERLTASDDIEIIVTLSGGITVSKSFIPGWNWFSLNIIGEEMSINEVLASFSDNAISIRSQTQSALYYDDLGWFGSLNEINNTSFYKINIENSVTWEYFGIPVDPSEITYNLLTGWNWISYAPQIPEEINYALSELYDNGSNIKSQTQSAIYYDELGWFGSLTMMQPLDGYMLSADADIEFSYPQPIASRDNNAYYHCVSSRDYELLAYEFNGTMVLSSDNDIPENSSIVALVNGERRSISTLLDYSSIFGRRFYLLMLYSNDLNEDNFELYYQESENSQLQPIDYNFCFQADMTCGDYRFPVLIKLPLEIGDPLPASNLLTVYPNPFNPETNIHFELSEQSTTLIEIYNLKGQKLETLLNCELPVGNHSLVWNPQNQSSGIYFLKFKTSDTMMIRKMILLR